MVINGGTAWARMNIPDMLISDLLAEGQPPPIVTGTVRLPQGGTRPSEAAVIAGQEYLAGAKEPTDIIENMQKKFDTVAPVEVRECFVEGDASAASTVLTGLVQSETADILAAYPENNDEAIAVREFIQNVTVETGADTTMDEMISTITPQLISLAASMAGGVVS